MLSIQTVHGVARIHLWSRVGRALGYSVSAYVTRGVLVDTGFPGARDAVRAALDGLQPEGVMVTHAHEDHAGNVALAAERGLPIAAAPATLEQLRAPGPIRLYRRVVWHSMRAVRERVEPFAHDALALLPAPGHSPDHHVVWDAERGQLFGGDLFLGVKVRLAHPDEDPRQLAATLRRLASLEPEVLFDAHRGPLRAPAPLLRAKADWIEETVAEIEQALAAGATDRQARRTVLGAEPVEAWCSGGEFSATNFVRAVRSGWRGGTTPARGRGADARVVAGGAGGAGDDDWFDQRDHDQNDEQREDDRA